MAGVEELIKLRRLFLGHTISERIAILNKLAAKDADSNRWGKLIPHEMKDFDTFFARYTPSELMQMAILSGQRVPNNRPNNSNGSLFVKYFVFDDVHNKITVLQNIDAICKDVFDKQLAVLGPDVVGQVLAEFAVKDPYDSCTYKLPIWDFLSMQKSLMDIADPNAVVEINLVKMNGNDQKDSTLCEIFVEIPGKGKKLVYSS